MTYIVTGGKSGLGLSIVNTLRQKDLHVLTISRRIDNSDPFHIQADATDYGSLKAAYRLIKKEYPYCKGLINCAGIASMNLALTTPFEITRQVIELNLIGTIYSCQVFSPLLIKKPNSRIINFSTIAVPLSLEGESIYVASKAGVEAFSKVLAKELSPFKTTVNVISPGPVKTNLLKGLSKEQIHNIVQRQIFKNELKSADIDDCILMLTSSLSNNLTGHVFNVGGVR